MNWNVRDEHMIDDEFDLDVQLTPSSHAAAPQGTTIGVSCANSCTTCATDCGTCATFCGTCYTNCGCPTRAITVCIC